MPILTSPYDAYVDWFSSFGVPFANFSHHEVEVGNWIEANTPKDFAIYSDPTMVQEMRGSGFRTNIEAIGWNATVKEFVREGLTSNDAKNAHNNIVSHFGKEVLIVLTPRTSQWLKDPKTLSVEFPSENFESFNGFEKFSDERYFTPLYHSKSIFIFAPK